MSKQASRIRAAFKRTYADSVPAYPITGIFTARLVGKTIREYLTDPDIQAEAQLAANERYQPDIVVMMADLLMEVEAMGAELNFPDQSVCYMKKHLLEDKRKLDTLEIPNPLQDGRLPVYLAACRKVVGAAGGTPVGGTLVGPWSLAVSLRGFQNVIYDIAEDPDFLHDLMKLCTRVAIETGDALVETGTGLSYSEATTSCSIISPDIYRTFVKPYHREMMDYYRERKKALTLHVCGFIDPIMEDLVEIGPAAISIDSASSLEKMIGIADQRVVVIGNVATATFDRGVKSEIEDETRFCINTAANKSAYILSSGCELPPTAPLESVDYFMAAARHFGKYESSN